MNDLDQQHDEFANDESIQITNLTSKGAYQRSHTTKIAACLYQRVTTPRGRYGLSGLLFLTLLGLIFLQFPRSASAIPQKYALSRAEPSPTMSTPLPSALLVLQRRSLHLPTVTSHAPCPTTPEQRVNSQVGIVQGVGPAYATIGAETIVSPAIFYYADAQYFENGIDNQGWGGQKVLWFVNPHYQGFVLVRGHQLDGPHPIYFDMPSQPLTQQLVIDTTLLADASPWPNFGSYTRLQAPGCYAYQVDGANFSYLIVFQAVVRN